MYEHGALETLKCTYRLGDHGEHTRGKDSSYFPGEDRVVDGWNFVSGNAYTSGILEIQFLNG